MPDPNDTPLTSDLDDECPDCGGAIGNFVDNHCMTCIRLAKTYYERALNEAKAVRPDGWAALQELVRLKDLKEKAEAIDVQFDMGAYCHKRELLDEYERCKPLAWEAARKVLSASPAVEATTRREQQADGDLASTRSGGVPDA